MKNKRSFALIKIGVMFFLVALVFFPVPGFFGVKIFAEDISDIQDDIENISEKIEKVENQLEKSQVEYNSNQTQINTTQKLLVRTRAVIDQKEAEIKNLNQKIDWNKKLLEKYVQELSFESPDDQMVNLAFSANLLNELSLDFDQAIQMKEKILSVVEEIKEDKNDLSEAKEDLSEKEDDHEKLLSIKQMEQAEVKAEIQSAQATLDQLNSKLSQLRKRYSEILGKSVSTEDIMKAAEFASKATGMNKSFLLGVLIQESNKGQSTGSCNYKESKMSSTQLGAFKKICENLDYDYKKMKVSCPPKNYKGTGGAMGVPQFMPTTWLAYEDDIASYTDNSTPDPWNLVDGVTAMAIKLSRDGAAKKTRFAEAKSYCVYLAGGNWGYYCFGSDKYKKSYEDVNCWGSSIKNYGEKVLCLKDNYEKYY